jgi:hypothetical protein
VDGWFGTDSLRERNRILPEQSVSASRYGVSSSAKGGENHRSRNYSESEEHSHRTQTPRRGHSNTMVSTYQQVVEVSACGEQKRGQANESLGRPALPGGRRARWTTASTGLAGGAKREASHISGWSRSLCRWRTAMIHGPRERLLGRFNPSGRTQRSGLPQRGFWWRGKVPPATTTRWMSSAAQRDGVSRMGTQRCSDGASHSRDAERGPSRRWLSVAGPAGGHRGPGSRDAGFGLWRI